VKSHGRTERAQDQLLEHDLAAKVVSTFADHASGFYLTPLRRQSEAGHWALG
jgi:hypothetical protein